MRRKQDRGWPTCWRRPAPSSPTPCSPTTSGAMKWQEGKKTEVSSQNKEGRKHSSRKPENQKARKKHQAGNQETRKKEGNPKSHRPVMAFQDWSMGVKAMR